MNQTAEKEYLAIVGDLLRDPSVLSMDQIKQHVEGFSCLDHSIFVSYLSFLMCRKLGLDEVSAARAGLLHDLHLQDWEKTDVGRFKRLSVHPKMACENAEQFGLNDLERDIIVKHMWPINPTQIPMHRESYIVSLADKMCATAEFMRLFRLLYVTKDLKLLKRRRAVLSLG